MSEDIKHKLGPGEYIPKEDRESDNPAIFILKPLNAFDEMDVMAEVTMVDKSNMRISGTGARKATTCGLVDWRGNARDRHGKPLGPYSREKVETMSPGLVSELAWEIIFRSQISEDEAKNS